MAPKWPQSFKRTNSSNSFKYCKTCVTVTRVSTKNRTPTFSEKACELKMGQSLTLPSYGHRNTSNARYKTAAAILRTGGCAAAPVELPGRLLVVNCEDISRKLLRIAGKLSKGALQRLNFTLTRLTGERVSSFFFYLHPCRSLYLGILNPQQPSKHAYKTTTLLRNTYVYTARDNHLRNVSLRTCDLTMQRLCFGVGFSSAFSFPSGVECL